MQLLLNKALRLFDTLTVNAKNSENLNLNY